MPVSSDQTWVMAFGTFDFFHAGHQDYLKQARALGDRLIVVLARDETTKKVKGDSPKHNERRRLREVLACEHVDKAVLGNADDKYKVIKKYKPNIIALGYDQFVFTYGIKTFLINEKIDAKIVRMQSFKPDVFKSSIIRQEQELENNQATTPCDHVSSTT